MIHGEGLYVFLVSFLVACIYCHHAYLLPPHLLISTILITLHQALSFFLTNCLLVLNAGDCTMAGKASMKGVLSKVWGQEKAGTSGTRNRRPPNRLVPEGGGEGEPEVPRARARGRGRGRSSRPRTRPVLEVSATEQAAPRRQRVSSTPSASEVLIAY